MRTTRGRGTSSCAWTCGSTGRAAWWGRARKAASYLRAHSMLDMQHQTPSHKVTRLIVGLVPKNIPHRLTRPWSSNALQEIRCIRSTP